MSSNFCRSGHSRATPGGRGTGDVRPRPCRRPADGTLGCLQFEKHAVRRRDRKRLDPLDLVGRQHRVRACTSRKTRGPGAGARIPLRAVDVAKARHLRPAIPKVAHRESLSVICWRLRFSASEFGVSVTVVGGVDPPSFGASAARCRSGTEKTVVYRRGEGSLVRAIHRCDRERTDSSMQ